MKQMLKDSDFRKHLKENVRAQGIAIGAMLGLAGIFAALMGAIYLTYLIISYLHWWSIPFGILFYFFITIFVQSIFDWSSEKKRAKQYD